jgi:hypothetical protein
VGLLLNPLETNGVLSKTCRLSQVKKHNSQPKKQQNTDTMAPPSRRPPAARIQQVNAMSARCAIDLDLRNTVI